MKFLLIYSHADEPVTKALLSSNFANRNELKAISVFELLNEVSIFDEFDHEEVKINWYLKNGIKLTNSIDFYLINRVLSVPEEMFDEFLEEDRAYSISEFRAYLAFALEAFPRSLSKPGAFGLSGNRFSLPRQWEEVQRSCFSLHTPEYCLGDIKKCDLRGDVVYSNPFNFYNWKCKKDENEINEATFAFIKPKGRPVVSCVFENNVKIFLYKNCDELSRSMVSVLEEASLNLSRLFNFSIAEILFFVDDNNFTFGMISNIPYASSKNEWFLDMVGSFFKNKLMEFSGAN